MKIIVHGYRGNMGQVLLRTILEHPKLEVVAAVDQHVTDEAFPTYQHISDVVEQADVIIDFSHKEAINGLLAYVQKKKIPLVLCTTAIDSETEKIIDLTSKTVPIFYSANMSFGINLMVKILKDISAVLFQSGFDIEILEKHHNKKLDAPSGTAKLLYKTINDANSGKLVMNTDRHHEMKIRNKNEIGISSIRAASIAGEHAVFFVSDDESIEIKHEAYSKKVFAQGALKAAFFMQGKNPGIYTMENLL